MRSGRYSLLIQQENLFKHIAQTFCSAFHGLFCVLPIAKKVKITINIAKKV